MVPGPGATVQSADADDGRAARGLSSYFESKGHLRHPSGSLVPPPTTRRRCSRSRACSPSAVLPRPAKPPPARRLTTVQKCFADAADTRRGRPHRAPPDVLRDARQLLDRRLLQGRRDRPRLGVRRRAAGLDPGPALGHGLRGRPGARARRGRGASRAGCGSACRASGSCALPRAENFWQAGRPGPCGPNTELYLDRGEELGCGRRRLRARAATATASSSSGTSSSWSTTCDDGRDADAAAAAEHRHRPRASSAAAVLLQGVDSVFETDGFRALIDVVERAEPGRAYGDEPSATKALRVLADHGRGDDVPGRRRRACPRNEGRGYVLRRDHPPRRPATAAASGSSRRSWPSSPDVVHRADGRRRTRSSREQRRADRRVLRAEEERFSQTLARGERLLEEVAGRAARDLRATTPSSCTTPTASRSS